MARKFSHPEIQRLPVGGSYLVENVPVGVLSRRVRDYAKRAGRAYALDPNAINGTELISGATLTAHLVTRLPDPEQVS